MATVDHFIAMSAPVETVIVQEAAALLGAFASAASSGDTDGAIRKGLEAVALLGAFADVSETAGSTYYSVLFRVMEQCEKANTTATGDEVVRLALLRVGYSRKHQRRLGEQAKRRLYEDLTRLLKATRDGEKGWAAEVAVTREAIAVMREMAAAQPETCTAELAIALAQMASSQLANNVSEQFVLDALNESVALASRGLGSPANNLRALGTSQRLLGWYHTQRFKDFAKGLEYSKLSVATMRQLVADPSSATSSPSATSLGLAQSLHAAAECAAAALEFDFSIACFGECIQLFGQLAEENPLAYASQLATEKELLAKVRKASAVPRGFAQDVIQKQAEAARAQLATINPDQCSHCAAPPRPGKRLLLCAGCKTTRYCDPQCQRAHWAQHKTTCKQHQNQ